MARRMREEWGSVTEIDRGKRYRLRYWAETPDGYKRVSETVRGTRRDAYNTLAMRRIEHSSDAPCPTVGQVWTEWFVPTAQQRIDDGGLARSTFDSYRTAWTKHSAPRWSNVPFDQVRPLDVQRWVSSLTYNTAVISLCVTKQLGDIAVRYELVQTNPFRQKYVMPSKSTSTQRGDDVYSWDEILRLWHSVHSLAPWAEPAFILGAFAGCRVGEALGAMSDEVSGRVIDGISVALVPILRQAQPGTHAVTERLKNEQSRRTAIVVGPAADVIISAAKTTGPYLTNDGCGRTVLRRPYTAAIYDAEHDADLRHMPPTTFRNSWQTHMRWDCGIEPYLIEPMMGHVVPGVTGRHYDKPGTDQYVDVALKAFHACPYSANWDELGPK